MKNPKCVTEWLAGTFKVTATQDPKTGEWILLRRSEQELGRIKEKTFAQHFIRKWNGYDKLLDALKGDEENCVPNVPMILSQALLGNYEAVKSMLRELCSINAKAIALAEKQA